MDISARKRRRICFRRVALLGQAAKKPAGERRRPPTQIIARGSFFGWRHVPNATHWGSGRLQTKRAFRPFVEPILNDSKGEDPMRVRGGQGRSPWSVEGPQGEGRCTNFQDRQR